MILINPPYTHCKRPLVKSGPVSRSQSRGVGHLPHRLGWNLQLFWTQLQVVQDRGSSRMWNLFPFDSLKLPLHRALLWFIDLKWVKRVDFVAQHALSDSAHTKALIGKIRSFAPPCRILPAATGKSNAHLQVSRDVTPLNGCCSSLINTVLFAHWLLLSF